MVFSTVVKTKTLGTTAPTPHKDIMVTVHEMTLDDPKSNTL